MISIFDTEEGEELFSYVVEEIVIAIDRLMSNVTEDNIVNIALIIEEFSKNESLSATQFAHYTESWLEELFNISKAHTSISSDLNDVLIRIKQNMQNWYAI